MMTEQDSPVTWSKGRATARTGPYNPIPLWSSQGPSGRRTSSCSASSTQGAFPSPSGSVLQPWGAARSTPIPWSPSGSSGWVGPFLSLSFPNPVPAPTFPLHSRQWLEDALRENEPGSCFVFLVGTKKDLLVSRTGLEARGGPQENASAFSPCLGNAGRVSLTCLGGDLKTADLGAES